MRKPALPRSGPLSALILLCPAVLAAGCGQRHLRPQGYLDDSAIKESSGIVASRRHKDVFWTLNDSGNGPDLFAVDRKGKLIGAFAVPGAVNRDWEDIALDQQGNLLILDNTSRSDGQGGKTVYWLPEPDPRQHRALGPVQRAFYRYAASQEPFDCEAMFAYDGAVYLVSKPWDGSLPKVYRAGRPESGGFLELVAEVPVQTMVTGADISPDGRRIVLSSYRAVLVYEGKARPEDLLKSSPIVCPLNAGQVEGIAWRGDRIVLTNEQRDIFEIPSSKWRNRQAPAIARQLGSIPFLKHRPAASTPLAAWENGDWIQVPPYSRNGGIGRAAWSPQGLHLGLELPSDARIGSTPRNLERSVDDWFLPGVLYLLINPQGDRPLSYGKNDRCLVFTRNAQGGLIGRSLFLRPATLIRSSQRAPDWVEVEEDGPRILITITPDAPGFGRLTAGRPIGFNLILVRKDGQLASWSPLSRRFSWDQPSAWGLFVLDD